MDAIKGEGDLAVKDGRLLAEVYAEMRRQVDKWGVKKHKPLLWYAILGEEIGEVGKAILEAWYQDAPDFGGKENLYEEWWKEKVAEYRKELIQVAAVAISAIRALDAGDVP